MVMSQMEEEASIEEKTAPKWGGMDFTPAGAPGALYVHDFSLALQRLPFNGW